MKPTRDHDRIRAWADQHDAAPAEVSGTEDGTPAKIHFILAGGRSAETVDLQAISWEDFFARFELLGLSMAWDDSGQFALVRVEPDLPQAQKH